MGKIQRGRARATDVPRLPKKRLGQAEGGGGVALLGVPGIRDAFDRETMALLSPWLGEEAALFHSPGQWRDLLGSSPEIQTVKVEELSCFEAAWQDWLATDNEFAQSDAACWERIIRPHSCFVGMVIQKRP